MIEFICFWTRLLNKVKELDSCVRGRGRLSCHFILLKLIKFLKHSSSLLVKWTANGHQVLEFAQKFLRVQVVLNHEVLDGGGDHGVSVFVHKVQHQFHVVFRFAVHRCENVNFEESAQLGH